MGLSTKKDMKKKSYLFPKKMKELAISCIILRKTSDIKELQSSILSFNPILTHTTKSLEKRESLQFRHFKQLSERTVKVKITPTS